MPASTARAPSRTQSGGPARPHDGNLRASGARIAVAAISGAGSFVGLLPAALFLADGRYAWIALVLLIGFSAYAAFRLTPPQVTPPDSLEVVAAGLGTISQGAMVSLMALSMYIAIMGLHWLASRIANWFHYTLPIGWIGVATVTGLFVGVLGLLAIVPIALKAVWRALFPPVAGYPTPYRAFTLTLVGQFALIGGFLVAIVFTAFAFRWPLGRLGPWWCYGLTYALLLSTMPLWEMGSKVIEPRVFSSTEDAIGAILDAMGFVVVKQPRTGKAAFDPFLADIDFAIAMPQEERTFAILVKATLGLRLDIVSRATSAAHALARALKDFGGEGTVEPVLVLVGPDDTSEVAEVAAQLGSHVIRVPNAATLEPSSKDADGLKTIGEPLFGFLKIPSSTLLRVAMPSANAFAGADATAGPSVGGAIA